RDRLQEFEQKLLEISAQIELDESSLDTYEIDAEIPQTYLTPDILSISDKFEPFGEKNPQLLFLSKKMKVIDAMIMGKNEKQHLKLIIHANACKWPALFWNEGERLHRDFEIGDEIDILYHVERNSFNGIETPQLILVDLKKSSC
ncbi:MAG: single-stranded-DNA-specific exonuclease RecJ, partial [Treponema sp.]|nr:single-stranded-DNA-specific exonuclease RecJ [Treponema sp.]